MDFCNSLFYGLNNSCINKLQKVQNAAVRLITKKRKRESVSEALRELHWLRVEERIWYKILLITYKCISGIAPMCLRELLLPCESRRHILVTPHFGTKYGFRSFQYIAPRMWNELPTHIRLLDTVEKFKKGLKTYIFTNFDIFKSRVLKYM